MTVPAENDRPTPAATARECGLLWQKRGDSSANLLWETVLDLAVKAYWQRRGKAA